MTVYFHNFLFYHSCFLSHPGAFWGAFLAPIIAVMIFNVVIFVWVIVILLRHTKGMAAQKKEAISKKTTIRLMISVGGVMFLFGLTWLFAILTFSAPVLREIFQALFTVSNSFQGLFIFLFFCVFSKEAREHWKESLSCGRYTSSFLHPSHAKHNLSSGTGANRNKKATASTGMSSSTVGRTSHSSEVDTKSSNVYQSSTIARQVEAENTERALDYELPITSFKAETQASQEQTGMTASVIHETQLNDDEMVKEDLSKPHEKHGDDVLDSHPGEEKSILGENTAAEGIAVINIDTPIKGSSSPTPKDLDPLASSNEKVLKTTTSKKVVFEDVVMTMAIEVPLCEKVVENNDALEYSEVKEGKKQTTMEMEEKK